jgi:hypothetical protein
MASIGSAVSSIDLCAIIKSVADFDRIHSIVALVLVFTQPTRAANWTLPEDLLRSSSNVADAE